MRKEKIMEEIDLKKFATKLRRLRIKQKLSQEELSFLADIDRTHVGRIERLERIPKIDTVFKIAKALNVSLDELTDFRP